MKKCNKYISLIYKEADGIITDKESAKLENHIKTCKSCQEEYKIIKAVTAEFEEKNYTPLPENFNKELHKKLVEHNLSKPSFIPFYRRLPVNIIATACLALGIAVFAFNTGNDIEKINSHTQKKLPETQQTQSQNDKELEKEAVKTDVVNQEVYDNTVVKSKSIVLEDTQPVQEENLSAVANENFIKDDLVQSRTAINYLTLKVIISDSITSLIPYLEENGPDMYLAPMEKLEEIKEILKDYDFVIKNETEETKNLEKFVILYEQP